VHFITAPWKADVQTLRKKEDKTSKEAGLMRISGVLSTTDKSVFST